MKNLVKKHSTTTQPGDVFIFNDPYGAGGMHLPDFYIIKPVFVENQLEGYVATLAHQSDVGGIAPGGMSVYAQEVYQEGLRIPVLKLFDAGQQNDAILYLIERNTRMPINVIGDIRAQIAACTNGDKALNNLINRYGSDVFRHYTAALHDYTERVMRKHIEALPDGVYRFNDWLDGFGENPEPIKFCAALHIDGDHIHIDWTGTSDQVKAAINGPLPTTHAMSYLAVRCAVGTPMPNCEGYMRAITVTAPLGSIVNPREPAACGARGIICFRMFDALLGAFSQLLPDSIPAANEGGSSAPHIAGRDSDGRSFIVSGGLMGCWGGTAARDGHEGISNPAANLGNTPIELLESKQPVEITRYAFVANSGGPGRHRGGAALVRGYRLLADEAVLVMRSDRRGVTPYGLSGGLPGTPSWNMIHSGANTKLLPVCPMEATPMQRNDEFVHIQAGGGGFGDPLDRLPEKVLSDIENELITVEYAADVYGVVLEDGNINTAETKRKRAQLQQSGSHQKAYTDHFHKTIGIDVAQWRPMVLDH